MSSAPQHVAVDPPPPPDTTPPSRAKPLIPFVLLIATVLVPTLFWFRNSFARELDDARLEAYLSRNATATESQHGLTDLSRRIEAERRGAKPKDKPATAFYGQLANLASADGADGVEKRKSAAWVMQYDPTSDVFRTALLKLVADPEPLVAWNAATSLARHGSAAARPRLLEMLSTYEIRARHEGVFEADARLEETLGTGSGSRLGTIKTSAGVVEVLSPVLGRVMALPADGKTAAVGDVLAKLAPSQAAGMNALAALALPGIGLPEDVAAIEEFLRLNPSLEPQVAKQARIVIAALRGDHPASR